MYVSKTGPTKVPSDGRPLADGPLGGLFFDESFLDIWQTNQVCGTRARSAWGNRALARFDHLQADFKICFSETLTWHGSGAPGQHDARVLHDSAS